MTGILTKYSSRIYGSSCLSYQKSILPIQQCFKLSTNADPFNASTSYDDNFEDEIEPDTAISLQNFPLRRKYQNKGPILAGRAPLFDPHKSSVILFPGQGSQFVGMGTKLLEHPRVKNIYAKAMEVVDYDVLKMCQQGPIEELSKTVICQIAVFVTSLAALEKLKVDFPEAIDECIATAGFSVGEYAALVFAGALPFDEALKLLKERAEAMQQASERRESGLLTVLGKANTQLGLAMKDAIEYAESEGVRNPVCTVAIDLYTNCKVIGGDVKCLEFLQNQGKSYNVRALKRVPVSGAFHTKLMKPAEKRLKEALSDVTFSPPRIPVLANCSGDPYPMDKNQALYRNKLQKQITVRVRWEHILHSLFNQSRDFFEDRGVPKVFEVGPGKELTTIMRRYNHNVAAKMNVIDV